MITITVKKTGLIRRAYRIFIRHGNNEPFGDAYDEARYAVDAVEKLIVGDEPVRLLVEVEGVGGVSEQWLRGGPA